MVEKVKMKLPKGFNQYRVKREAKEFVLRIFTAILLIGISYTILAPVIGMFSTAFMSVEDLFNPMVFLIPSNPTFDNFRGAVQHLRFWNTLAFTLGYSMGLSLLHVMVASFVGYGFARYKFRGSNIIFAIVLLTFIIPPQAYMVPLWFQFRFFGPTNINLIDSYASVIILTLTGMGLRSGLFIYIFRQFFRGLPVEISEAARIDGCGHLRTYMSVMMPNAKPAIITVFMFSLVWHYGDTFFSGLLLTRPQFMHVSLGQVVFRWQSYNSRGGSMMFADFEMMQAQMVFLAAVTLIIVPIILVYAIMQRQFIEGIERSGIVG